MASIFIFERGTFSFLKIFPGKPIMELLNSWWVKIKLHITQMPKNQFLLIQCQLLIVPHDHEFPNNKKHKIPTHQESMLSKLGHIFKTKIIFSHSPISVIFCMKLPLPLLIVLPYTSHASHTSHFGLIILLSDNCFETNYTKTSFQ
jgi:hypothetical protein